MVLNISYCPPNVSVWDVWVNHGIPHCFMNTLTSSVLAAYILIAGTIQLCIYRKYGTEVSPNHISRSKLYYLQIFSTLFLPVLEIVRFVLQATVYDDKNIYGFMIVSLVLTSFAFPFSLWIIKVERHYLLPSVPTRGHGIILLVFWTLTFIAENLAFLNLSQKNWWFRLKDLTDQLEMSLFVLRYITCLLIFFLGLKAPGIMQNVDYFSLNDSQRNLTNRIYSGVTLRFNKQTLVFRQYLDFNVKATILKICFWSFLHEESIPKLIVNSKASAVKKEEL